VSSGRTEPESKAVALSGTLFQRLLAAYPKAHRREYGQPMAQLFRDQCRDAWRGGRGWGLTWLWLRVLPDLVKTSVLEHISTLKERKTMLERVGTLLRPRSAPLFVFIAVAVPVFLLVVATSTLITFILPESYASTARVIVRQAPSEASQKADARAPLGPYDPYFLQTQFEVIQSQVVLDKVINNLDLNKAWGKKYANGDSLRPSETLALLRGRLDLRPVRNTSLIEIRVFSDQPAEAAQLANAIAESYREYRSHIGPAEIVDMAVPGLRPVRPNKPMNIALGIIGGMFFALAAGAAVAVIAAWLGRRSRGTGTPPTTGAAPPPAFPNAESPRTKSTLDKVTGVLWMGIGGALSVLALLALVWFLIFQQASVTSELVLLPVFGLCWVCNAVLGFFLLRGKRWARICLGVEGVLFLTYYGLRYGFLDFHCSASVSNAILSLGWFIAGPLPQILRWVFIPLAIASVFALLWPRRQTPSSVC
jgi:capsular polysaccharide biosynthesis protein